MPDTALCDGGVAQAVGRLATQALLCEMQLTPKPGLVDQANSGAHRDMDLAMFRASVAAIAPWFERFFQQGNAACAISAREFFTQIRRDGMACEHAMLAATGGVNTHKGSVFAFGLLCAAAGRLVGRGDRLASEAVCAEVARMCTGLVEQELAHAATARSAGERLYVQHGLTGARGEAQSGFATARQHGVSAYVLARSQGMDDERALLEALLHLLAHNHDTNLVARGGLPGLALVQMHAQRLLADPCASTEVLKAQLVAFDQLLIAQHLSPGGSADLLAVSWFLAHLDTA